MAMILLGIAPRQLPAQKMQNSLPALASGETLKFKLSWPSGVSLGEAAMTVTAGQKDLHFAMTIDAELPVYNLSGSVSSVATRQGLCSIEYRRKIKEGAKTSEESIDFDQQTHQARRTLNGITASFPTPECARDPMTYLYYFRNQLAAGGQADPSTFFLGPERSIEVKPGGTESVPIQGTKRMAGRFSVTYQGTSSARTFEMWISADARREPVMVKLPSPLAIFTAELE